MKASTRAHVHYFDYLRLFAAFFVIYMHVSAAPLRSGISTDWHFINIFTSLGFTAVPLFFMMSGYLLLTDEKTSDISHLLKQRLPRLVIPLIMWSVIAILVRLSTNGALTGAAFFDALVSALNSPASVHLWYVYTLIALYLISPVLHGGLNSLSRSGHMLILLLIGLVSAKAMVQALSPAAFDKFFEIKLISQIGFLENHLCTFILGFYLGKLKKEIPTFALLTAIAALLATIVLGTYHLTEGTGIYTQTFQNHSAGFEVVLAACIFLFIKQTSNKKSRFLNLSPAISLSFAIYMMHNILLGQMEKSGVIAVSFFDTLWMTLLNYAICYLTIKTVSTIKPLCFIATGMTFSKACRTCNWIYTYNRVKLRFQKTKQV